MEECPLLGSRKGNKYTSGPLEGSKAVVASNNNVNIFRIRSRLFQFDRETDA